jgi:hypothetical protein
MRNLFCDAVKSSKSSGANIRKLGGQVEGKFSLVNKFHAMKE